MDLAKEISEAISQPVNFGFEFDDDELAEELELLEQEELDNKLLGDGVGDLGAAPSVPSQPIPGMLTVFVCKRVLIETAIAQPPRPTRVQVTEDDEDAELAELKASMAL